MKKNRILYAVCITVLLSIVVVIAVVFNRKKSNISPVKGNESVEVGLIYNSTEETMKGILLEHESTPEVELYVGEKETLPIESIEMTETTPYETEDVTLEEVTKEISLEETTNTTTTHMTTDKTIAPTEQPTTTEEQPYDGTEDEPDYVKFVFKNYKVGSVAQSFDWKSYFERQGYRFINNKGELASYGKSVLNNIKENKNISYIVTEKGLLDDIAELKDLSEAYFYDEIGLDYWSYYCKGVSVFKFRKIQDVVNETSNLSLYAIYYYSYVDSDDIKVLNDKIDAIVAEFSGSTYDKIKAAHDYICANNVYEDASNSHDAYGALINGKSVCDGYAKAFKLLMDAMNIDCNVVINDVHAWNEVYLDDAWYFVDLTNDDANSVYCYFLLGKDILYGDSWIKIDGHAIDSAYYGYRTDSNTSVNELSDTTYGYETRVNGF